MCLRKRGGVNTQNISGGDTFSVETNPRCSNPRLWLFGSSQGLKAKSSKNIPSGNMNFNITTKGDLLREPPLSDGSITRFSCNLTFAQKEKDAVFGGFSAYLLCLRPKEVSPKSCAKLTVWYARRSGESPGQI